MNDLEAYFLDNTDRLIHKWRHYFDVYNRHFSRFRGTEVSLVEIGVSHGGSLQMWKHYFGEQAKIYGIDIDPRCQNLEESQIKIIIGDQEDRIFLRSLKDIIPQIDILIDDGGHTMKQQIHTFEELYPRIDSNGVYLCEDMHTSYWKEWQGGYKEKGTFVEYCKNFIDYINAWHSHNQNQFQVSDFTRSTGSLHFYDSVLVIEKQIKEPPSHHKTGHIQFR